MGSLKALLQALLNLAVIAPLRRVALTATVVFSALNAFTPAQAADTKCDPSQACCQSVDIGGEPACAGAGNPINVITGNKYQREVDMPALPGVLGLEIVRHYNSADSGTGKNSRVGIIGRGWRLSYEIELSVSGSSGNIVEILQADGTSSNDILDSRRRCK